MRSRAAAALGLILLLASCAAAALADTDALRRLAAAGRPEEALRELESALAADPANVEARFLKGVLLTELGRMEEAVAVFEALIRSHPELPEPYNNLAVIHGAAGRWEAAAATLRRALASHSSYRAAYENLRQVEARLGGEADRRSPTEAGGAVELVLLGDLAAPPARPAPAAVPGAEPPPDDGRTIAARVREWATTWSERRVEDHLAFYSAAFRPPGGQNLEAWLAERRALVGAPDAVAGSVAILDSQRLDPERAAVRLLQSFRLAGRPTVVERTLVLQREKGLWRIVEERLEPDLPLAGEG